jgi:hypothetical protein
MIKAASKNEKCDLYTLKKAKIRDASHNTFDKQHSQRRRTMRLGKNTSRFIVLVTLVGFLGSCVGHTHVKLRPDDPIPTDKKVVVHWQNDSYVLENASVNDHILQGTVTRQNWKRLSRNKLVHAYIEKLLQIPMENQARCSIPVKEFDRIETYNISKGEKILKTSGAIAAGVAAFFIIAP